jgi:type I restriction enzyme, R subunit
MWMTGFDVPSCSTLYLDKPMRNPTLMQTIARANQVYPGKVSGLIVDYAGVFRNLERALAIYGAGGGSGKKPVEDKSALVAALRQVLSETRSLCQVQGVNLAAMQTAQGFLRISLLDDAVEALVVSEEIKRRYLDLANAVQRLYKAVLPDSTAGEFAAEMSPIQVSDREKVKATAIGCLLGCRSQCICNGGKWGQIIILTRSPFIHREMSKKRFDPIAAQERK